MSIFRTLSSRLKKDMRRVSKRNRIVATLLMTIAVFLKTTNTLSEDTAMPMKTTAIPIRIDENDVMFFVKDTETLQAEAYNFCSEKDLMGGVEGCAKTIADFAREYMKAPPPLDRVYVIHYEPYSDRKVEMSRQLLKFGLLDRTTWISRPDPEDLDLRDMPSELYDHMRFVREEPEDGLNPSHHAFFGRPLVPREIAVGMKHLGAWTQFLADTSKGDNDMEPAALVLEDDVILHPNFHTEMVRYGKQLRTHRWDLVCLGGAGFGDGFMGSCDAIPECQHRRPRDSNVYRKTWKGDGSNVTEIFDLNVMRYADSYILTRTLAKRLVERTLPFAFPADHQLNYFLNRWDQRVFWVQPTLTMQRLHLTQSRVDFLTDESVRQLDSYYSSAAKIRPNADFLSIKRRQGPYLWLCGTFHFTKQYANAEAACRRLWEVAPSDHALERTAWAMWRLAQETAVVEDRGAIVARLRRWLAMATDHSPTNARLRAMRGLVRIGDDIEIAAKHFELAISLDPNVSHFHNALGVALAFRAESGDAIARRDSLSHFQIAIDLASDGYTKPSLNREILIANDTTRSYSIELP